MGNVRLNGLVPEASLRYVLGRTADHPVNRIAELLLWRMAPTAGCMLINNVRFAGTNDPMISDVGTYVVRISACRGKKVKRQRAPAPRNAVLSARRRGVLVVQ